MDMWYVTAGQTEALTFLLASCLAEASAVAAESRERVAVKDVQENAKNVA
jgi:hypothetical protein